MRRPRFGRAAGVTLLEAILAAALLLVVLGGVVAQWSGGLAASAEQTGIVLLTGEAGRAAADLARALRNADPALLVVVRRGEPYLDPTSGRVARAESDMLIGLAEVIPGAPGEPLRTGLDGQAGRTAWVLAHDGALVRRVLGPGGAVESERPLVGALAVGYADAFRVIREGSRVEVRIRAQAGRGAARPLREHRTTAVLRNGSLIDGGTP